MNRMSVTPRKSPFGSRCGCAGCTPALLGWQPSLSHVTQRCGVAVAPGTACCCGSLAGGSTSHLQYWSLNKEAASGIGSLPRLCAVNANKGAVWSGVLYPEMCRSFHQSLVLRENHGYCAITVLCLFPASVAGCNHKIRNSCEERSGHVFI